MAQNAGTQQEWACCSSSIGPVCQHKRAPSWKTTEDAIRTPSGTVRILGLENRTGFDWWARVQKDNGNIVNVAFHPSFKGICMAAGFVGTGGRNIS